METQPPTAAETTPPLPPMTPGNSKLSLLLAVGGLGLAVVAVAGVVMVSGGGAKPIASTTDSPESIAAGKIVASKNACFTCHTDDGSINRGPTWKGLYGSAITYDDGSMAIVDDAIIREALVRPVAKIMENYEGIMPPVKLNEEDTKNLIAYMRSIGVGK